MAKPWESDPIVTAKPWDNDPVESDVQPASVAAPTDEPVTAGGIYKAVDRGAANAAAGIASLPRTVGTLGAQGIQGAANWVAGKLGLEQDTRDLTKQGLIPLPNAEEAAAAIQRDLYGGAAPYEPQNRTERYAQRGGENLLNAIMPGGLATKAASVIAPAIAGEATKEAGGGAGAQIAAELLGGIGVTKTANALARRAGSKALQDVDLAGKAAQNYADAKSLNVTLDPTEFSAGMGRIRNELSTKFGSAVAEDLQATKLLRPLETSNAPLAARPALDPRPGPPAKAPVSVDEIKHLREQLGQVAQGENATDRFAARMTQQKLDDFLANISPSAVVTGDAQQAAKLFGEARGNYAAMKRSDTIQGREKLGQINAEKAGSGMNLDNATRQAIATLIKPRLGKPTIAEKMGFSAAEIAQMRKINKGTIPENILRKVGNVLGGGGGLSQGLLGGAAIAAYESGHSEYLPLVLAGYGAKKLSGKMSQTHVRRLDDMVRSRAPGAPILPPIQPLSAFRGGQYALPGILADPQQRQLLLGQ